MSVYRRGTEFAKVVAYDRHLNFYLMGGNWDPYDRTRPTDCSGCVVDALDASLNGTAMAWTRHGLSTEGWRPPNLGGAADPHNGPFGTVMVSDPSQFPANAAVMVALHHGDGSPADSHMWCQVDNLKIETHGSSNDYPHGATVLNDGVNYTDQVLDVRNTDYANNWWYLPGPIVEDGTARCVGPSDPNAVPGRLAVAPDTLFADVSEFQPVVDDSYTSATYSDRGQDWPYRWISIRSNDGEYVDHHFADNYAWCVNAVNDGRLEGFSVYYVWRPGPGAVHTHMQLLSGAGGPHPKINTEVDVETWRETNNPNPAYDVSPQINSDVDTLATWYGGNRARVIGYGNCSDINTMWPCRPAGLLMRYAAYGNNPDKPDQVAHQYTDDHCYGGGLPNGVAPFGNCDMNSADNLAPAQYAAKLGLTGAPSPVPSPVPTPKPVPAPPNPTYPPFLDGLSDRQVLNLIAVQLLGPDGTGWPQGGADQQAIAQLDARVAAGGNLTPTDIVCWLKQHWQGKGLGGPQ